MIIVLLCNVVVVFISNEMVELIPKTMKQFILLLFFAVALVSCKQEIKHIQTADLIVTNAKVAVMDNNKTITEAIAVKDGKVLATGTTEEILKLKNVNEVLSSLSKI